jgi:hypothetical protein
VDASRYVAECVSNIDQLLDLAKGAGGTICDESGMLALHSLINLTADGRWDPRVIVVRRGGALVGFVYTKERKLHGVRTGLIHGDACRGPLIASDPDNRQSVWRCALHYLLTRRTVLGIRLEVLDTERTFFAEKEILSQLHVVASHRQCAVNSTLYLTSNYEDLLSQMGPHTRRNFRYYRRQFEQCGNEYVEPMALTEFRAAALDLIGKSAITAEKATVENRLRMCQVASRPLLVGLRAGGGGWLAILGGWFERDQATVLFQMNCDREHSKESLSLVLRGYLIESLIRRRVRSIVFLGGVSDPLKRYGLDVPVVILYMDKTKGRPLCPASFLKLAARLAPPSLASKVPWIFNVDG